MKIPIKSNFHLFVFNCVCGQQSAFDFNQILIWLNENKTCKHIASKVNGIYSSKSKFKNHKKLMATTLPASISSIARGRQDANVPLWTKLNKLNILVSA